MIASSNGQDFIKGEILEVNEMVGGKSMRLCEIDVKLAEVKFEYFYYLNISIYTT